MSRQSEPASRLSRRTCRWRLMPSSGFVRTNSYACCTRRPELPSRRAARPGLLHASVVLLSGMAGWRPTEQFSDTARDPSTCRGGDHGTVQCRRMVKGIGQAVAETTYGAHLLCNPLPPAVGLLPAHKPRYLSPCMAILLFIVFIDLLGFGVMIPLLPFYGLHFGATPTEATWMIDRKSVV